MKASLLLLLVACGGTPRDPIPQNQTEAPFVPPACTAAPPECLPAELGLAGEVVIVEYWATWCSPCQAEVPTLNAADERYRGRGVAIVGISTESLAADELAQAIRDFDLRYPVIPIDQALADQLDVPSNLPTGYVFDKHGYRRDTHVGVWDEAELTETIDRLLSEP